MGSPKPRRKASIAPGLAAPPLAFVRHQQDPRLALAQRAGEALVEGGQAFARIHHQQHRVGGGDRLLRLGAHAREKRLALDILEAGGIHHGEDEIGKPSLPFAAVAGDPGQIVDDRLALAHQAVEQGRFADIGPTDDGESEGHDRAAPSAQRDQIGVVGQDIESALGHDRRQMRGGRQRDRAQDLAGIGRDGQGLRIGAGQDQAVSRQDRPMPEDLDRSSCLPD